MREELVEKGTEIAGTINTETERKREKETQRVIDIAYYLYIHI